MDGDFQKVRGLALTVSEIAAAFIAERWATTSLSILCIVEAARPLAAIKRLDSSAPMEMAGKEAAFN
jgi:hypothetical protein